jgi:hypothetical protein
VLGRTLVLAWGDRLNEDGTVAVKAMYGAHALVTPDADGFSVSARIYIGRPDALASYQMDCGVIGHAQSLEEAHETWGKVTWLPDAVVFGDLATGFRVARSDFQRHR